MKLSRSPNSAIKAEAPFELKPTSPSLLSLSPASSIVKMATSDPEKSPNDATLSPSDSLPITPASSIHRDDNYETYKASKEIQVDAAELKRVLRKIDFRIIPILFVTYMLQYLDKNSINFASVYHLKEDTHLVGQDYSWLGILSLHLKLHILSA